MLQDLIGAIVGIWFLQVEMDFEDLKDYPKWLQKSFPLIVKIAHFSMCAYLIGCFLISIMKDLGAYN
jgi:hypothetical protein